MAHSSEIRWNDIAARVASNCATMVRVLIDAEELYRDLLELYEYAGSDDTALAAQLFAERIAADSDTGPTAEEVAKVTDMRNAMVAVHQIYQAGNNVSVSQSDRFAALRRMS